MDRGPGKLPGLTFEEAAGNVKKNLEALGKPSQEESAKQEFLQVYNSRVNRRDGAVAMLKWLEGNGFFEAPASSKYHLAQPGGLVIHSHDQVPGGERQPIQHTRRRTAGRNETGERPQRGGGTVELPPDGNLFHVRGNRGGQLGDPCRQIWGRAGDMLPLK